MEGRIPDQDRVAVSHCPMMASARFSIGIDLGTTNCALAFVPLDSEARSRDFRHPAMGHVIHNNGVPGASVLSLLTGRGHRSADPARDGRRRGVGRRPARTQKGRGITRPGRPFSQILALPSYIGSLGALSALGIGGHRARQQDFTGTRLGADP